MRWRYAICQCMDDQYYLAHRQGYRAGYWRNRCDGLAYRRRNSRRRVGWRAQRHCLRRAAGRVFDYRQTVAVDVRGPVFTCTVAPGGIVDVRTAPARTWVKQYGKYAGSL